MQYHIQWRKRHLSNTAGNLSRYTNKKKHDKENGARGTTRKGDLVVYERPLEQLEKFKTGRRRVG